MTPLSADRIAAVDVLRGFALFGILLVNMRYFSSPALYVEDVDGNTFNRVVAAAIDLLFEASAYPLFAFLFGFGTIVLCHRLHQRGERPFPILLRRFLLLLVIGIIHAFGLWFGDILIPYALAGLILLLFMNAPSYWWRMAALTGFFFFHILVILLLVMSMLAGGTETAEGQAAEAAAALHHYQSGTFREVFWQRWHDWSYLNGDGGLLFTLLAVLPFCFLGGYAAKERWLEAGRYPTAALRRLMSGALCLGLVLKTIPYWAGSNTLTMYIQDNFGGAVLAVFYAIAAMLVCRKTNWQPVWRWLQDAGRMSLTHYLTQSLICTSLFYSYGLGWYGQLNEWQGALLAIGIYVASLWASHCWFTRFRFGPAEWLWRWGTYGMRPPFRRQPGQ
ncbi:DUF418 domain-containing protein [Geobacillus thermodenitrificans]|uniref:DUF418 domain-containing protein n=1 Tax=Geobacillus thermodenitrificans TaxID=33940 RepID=UPI0003FA324D|nr:DUF418 domain-containing protein [Geobacillus thermodenitrificans]ARA97580.1 hypothetical protein GD3902_05565 [Geobacillus thermodenitrificans]